MEQVIPIEWPRLGLVEGFSFSDQPELSARELQNMRYQDCVTGRLRGASRAGQTKYLTSPLKLTGTKAVGLLSFFVDNRQVTFALAADDAATAVWTKAVPSLGACKNVKADRQGNVYALDGRSSITKYSADGEKLWSLVLPVKDPKHEVRALAVDEFDRVYAGVSEGGDQEKAALWCYEQIPDNKVEQLWEIVTKAYTEELKLFQDRLYTVQNRTTRKKGYVRIYDFIDEANPELVQEWRTNWPANSIAVKADGSVIVACGSNDQDTTLHWRDRDPVYPESSPDSEDWTPLDLVNADRRIWFWAKGDDLDQTDVVTDIANGVEISRWRDSSKGLRHLIVPYDDAQSDIGPELALDAWLEHKGLRFTQSQNQQNPDDPPFQALRSNPNASIAKTTADQQRTMLPGYTGSAWACFIMCRPSPSEIDGGAVPRWLFGHDRDTTVSGGSWIAGTSHAHMLFINASAANGNNLAPTAATGRVFWFTGQNVSGGDSTTANQIREGTVAARQDNGANADTTTTNKGQIALISMLCDGASSGSVTSRFNINGSPIDSFISLAQATLRATYLGIFRPTHAGDTNPSQNVNGYLGDILEILVLDMKDRSDPQQGVVTSDDFQYNSPGQDQSNNEWTQIQGYFMHRFGGQECLPFGTAGANNYPHPFGITGTGQDRLSGPPHLEVDGTTISVSAAQALANKAWAAVIKYDAKGKIVWCANEMELIGGLRSGGYGYAVALNSDGNIYSLGPQPTGSGSDDNVEVRMIVDQGTTFSIQTSDGAWSAHVPLFIFRHSHPRIDVDEFDNLYIPIEDGTGPNGMLKVYKKDGTLLVSQELPSLGETPYAVAVDRRTPDYRNDLANKIAEHVLFASSTFDDIDNGTVTKLRLVNSTQVPGAVRTLYSLGVSGGDIVRFTTSGVSTPTGGSGALDSDARYIQGTTLFKKAYWTDGRQLRVFDPIADTVTAYTSTSAGAIPSRCALIEAWRGRIVMARSSDEPHNWFMSKKDDPTNFDYFPPVPSEIDAVAGNNSNAGQSPDIINTIVPYSEDILVFGGDRSIWALVGDPAAGGRLELVSSITGMAYGRPWCQDPNGVLYFVGSRGGLFRWMPGAKPERMSLGRIERALQDIDFSTYHVKLAWNYQDDGIHIVQCPFGAGGTQVAHYFWEARNDGFAKDIFGTTSATNVQPTDILVLDGDEFDDRVLIFGCEDGFIRKLDCNAKSDDTETDGVTKIAIDSFVTIFPIQAGEQNSGLETQFQGLTVVLGDRDDGCRYELFAADEADALGLPTAMGVLGPGRNAPMWDRATGAYCGLRLRNASAEERFTFERAYIYGAPAGLVRPRTRN